jgi:hypothetical protein
VFGRVLEIGLEWKCLKITVMPNALKPISALKARVLDPGKYLQPSLLFLTQAGA